MNNRTNLLKKRADTLAEYVVDRCDRLERENCGMRHEAEIVRRELSEYERAFFDTLGKLKGIKKLDDGGILIGFIAEDGAEMGQIIPVNGFLYPIAKLLLEKNGIWMVKRCKQ